MSEDAKDLEQNDAPPLDNDGKAQTDQEKKVNAIFAEELRMRDKLRIVDATDRDAAGIRSCKQWSEVELTQNGVLYSSFLLTMIREFTPRLSLVEMHQVKDLLYGLMINLLRFQDRKDFKGVPLLSRPEGSMAAIKAATRILLDIPTDQGRVLAHYLEIVSALVRRMPTDEKKRAPMLWVFRDQLTLECDERFETLPIEFISEKLDEMVWENVKGRGKNGIVGVAAQLAIEVGAWGFDKLDNDPTVNTKAARDKLFQAQKNARKSEQTAQREYWESYAAKQTSIIEWFEEKAKEKGLKLDSSFPRLNAAKEALAIANEQVAIANEQVEKTRKKKTRE